jgi:hypothetical protein
MPRRIRVVVLGLVAAASMISAAAARAQRTFEGVIVYTLRGDAGKGGEMRQTIKGLMVRQDVTMAGKAGAGPNPYMITDGARATMTSVMPEQKMYMTMDLKQSAKDAKAMSQAMGIKPGEKTQHTTKFTRTGEKQTIAGYTCENFIIGDEQNSEMCVTKDLGMISPFGAGSGRGRGMGSAADVPPEYRELYAEFKDGFFMMQMSKLKGGKWQPVMTVKSVERRSVPESEFAIPAGYKPLVMPNMKDLLAPVRKP